MAILKRANLIFLLLIVAVFISGCSKEPRKRRNTDNDVSEGDGTSLFGDILEEPKPEKTVEPKADPQPAPVEIESVGADDAQKGSTIGGGIISEPLHQRFHIEHRLTFMQVTQAMNLYKAEFGYFPKTHEEFMKKIIKANSLKLPELQDDWKYFYDKEDSTLKKRRGGE